MIADGIENILIMDMEHMNLVQTMQTSMEPMVKARPEHSYKLLQKSFLNFLHSSHALRFVGHLVELAQPEVYDTKYSKWVYADLPIFPMNWQYEVSAGTKKQFGILKTCMHFKTRSA